MNPTPPNTELKSAEEMRNEWRRLVEEAVNSGNIDMPDGPLFIKLESDFYRSIQHNAMLNAATIAHDTTFAPGKKDEWEQAYDKGCTDAAEAITERAEQILKGADKESLYDALRSDDHNKD